MPQGTAKQAQRSRATLDRELQRIARETREQLVFDVVNLARQKVTRRTMTRTLGVSRNTIRKILAALAQKRDEGHPALSARPPRLPRASKLDPFKPRVNELFAKYPDITAQRVLEILTEEGFQGGYTAVKKYVRKPPHHRRCRPGTAQEAR